MRAYQQAFEEGLEEGRQEGERQGKLRAVPSTLALGASVEEVAQALGLEIEQVRQMAQNQSQN